MPNAHTQPTGGLHKYPGDHSAGIGYVRVSTSDQAESGAGLAAQRAAIEAEAARRGWELTEIYTDTASGKSWRAVKR